MPGDRLAGWQSGWALSSMMENKGFVCHRRDRINQNKQPRTDCHTNRLSHAWIEEMGDACLTFYMK